MRRSLSWFSVWTFIGTVGSQLPAADQPNILFLFADDLCYETVHALGYEPAIDTPHLDRLVSRGTSFDRCYNMGSWSGAVCVASRTMLNSGRSVWRANAIYNNSERERDAGRWWSEHLKQAGYRTYLTGKWHCKADPNKAFDVARNVRGGMPKDTPESYNRPRDGVPDQWSPYDKSLGGFWEGGKHWSEVVADDAIGFLEDARGRDQPFFIYAAFNAAHDPRQSPREYVERYPLGRIALPVNFIPEYPYKDAIGCGPSLRDEKLAPFPRTEHAVRVHRQEYYALITHMDVQIGRILDALRASGREGETWVFFTADHGLAIGHHGLFGKQNLYDHSVRVPFVVAGPGVGQGRRRESPIYLQDVMPTTLELAGVARPEHVEFQSLLPLLREDAPSKYDAVYGAYLNLQRMVSHDGWKLIVYPEAKVARLYHLAEDPQEQHDLAGDSSTLPRRQALFAELQRLQRQMQDTLDLSVIFPELRR
jgi:arylsulfatase A-like enzyme